MEYVDHILTDQSLYRIRYPEAARVDNQKVGQTLWDSDTLVKRLCPAFAVSGQQVVCRPVEGYPLSVVTTVAATQLGEGEPSPENVRPIAGCTQLQLQHRSADSLLSYSCAPGTEIFGGSFHWTTGIFDVTHCMYTLDETASMVKHTDGKRYYLSGGLPDMQIGNCLSGLCDSLPVLAPGEKDDRPALQLGSVNNYPYLCNMEKLDSSIVDAESLKAYLQEHPITFVYPLAEPWQCVIEPARIEAFAGENCFVCNTGLTTVSGRSVPPYMQEDSHA